MITIPTGRDRTRRKTLARIEDLLHDGRYEEAEAAARALDATPRRPWQRPRREWEARTHATYAAVALGRTAEVLPELEELIAGLEPLNDAVLVLRLVARNNRAVALVGLERYPEAEAETLAVLRQVARLSHLHRLAGLEMCALETLAQALCGQGRHEEAEAIVRGNLYRAGAHSLAPLLATLTRSLNGQGRYEEALAEARRSIPVVDRAESGHLGLVTAQALLGLGRREEAEAAVRRALAECERDLHPAHPRTAEARALLARVTGEEPGP